MRIDEPTDLTPFETTHAWLRASNAAHVPNDYRPVRLVAHDDDDRLVGSLDGEIDWGKLHVDNVVVRPDARLRGIGARLMHAAEKIAADAGCTGVHLDTMSFQALAFYRRLGYDEVGTIAGFAGQSVKHFLHKSL